MLHLPCDFQADSRVCLPHPAVSLLEEVLKGFPSLLFPLKGYVRSYAVAHGCVCDMGHVRTHDLPLCLGRRKESRALARTSTAAALWKE